MTTAYRERAADALRIESIAKRLRTGRAVALWHDDHSTGVVVQPSVVSGEVVLTVDHVAAREASGSRDLGHLLTADSPDREYVDCHACRWPGKAYSALELLDVVLGAYLHDRRAGRDYVGLLDRPRR